MSPAYATTFAVLDIRPEPYAVTPILSARVGVASIGAEPVHAIALRAQVRIEPGRRSYSDAETAGLLDLFGPRERWSQTQRSFLWMHCATTIPGFSVSFHCRSRPWIHQSPRRRALLPTSQRSQPPP